MTTTNKPSRFQTLATEMKGRLKESLDDALEHLRRRSLEIKADKLRAALAELDLCLPGKSHAETAEAILTEIELQRLPWQRLIASDHDPSDHNPN